MVAPELHRLLRSLFSLEELTWFLAELPGGDDLVAGLPTRGASLDDVAHAAVDALERRGSVDGPLFARLLSARPGRTGEIRRLAAACGLELPLDEEIGLLLEQGSDATARARLAEIGKMGADDRDSFQESMLVCAEIAALRRTGSTNSEDATDERSPLTSRVRALVARMEAAGRSRGNVPANEPSGERRATAIYDEIVAAIQLNEGERAALRLLDLTRLCGGARDTLQRVILLSAQVHAWRQAHAALRTASRPARDEWMQLLRDLLVAADAAMRPASGSAASDATTLPELPPVRGREAGGASPCVFRGRGLRKRYPRSPQFQLQDVDLELRPGALVGVVGPNGAGKTTLLRVVAGELAADSGTLTYPALDGPRGDLDWPRIRRRIGHVRQRLTAWHGPLVDNLHVWAARHGIRGQSNADAVEYALSRFRLEEMRHATWSQLSGGFQTRFELARALLPQPRLLVLDEPLAPLDVMAQQRFLRDLRDLATSEPNQPAVLISSQHIHEIERVADEILCLREDGRVEFHGHSSALADDDAQQVFELEGYLGPEVRDALVRRLGADVIVEESGVVVLWAPPAVDLQQVVQVVHAAGGMLDDVRNISRSVMRLFREKSR